MDTQKRMFFSGKWSKYDNNRFITNLEFFARGERRPLNIDDREIMEHVRDWLNPKKLRYRRACYHPTPVFTLTDIYRRFELAEQRYKTWKHIIGYRGVVYNVVSNTVRSTPEAMVELCEMHTLGGAYLWEPEYKWRELQIIFGYPGMMLGGPNYGSPDGHFSRLLQELLEDIEREENQGVSDDSSSSDDEMELPQIPPPDVMSTTKGKGHIIHDPVAQTIDPNLRRPLPMDVAGTSDVKKAGSCSSVVKRFLKL